MVASLMGLYLSGNGEINVMMMMMVMMMVVTGWCFARLIAPVVTTHHLHHP